MSQFLSCAETAKMIRAALKESFPKVRFGVRSHVYSGGASIRVTWTDGPNTAQVESIVQRFSGAVFDGMIDLKSYTRAMIDGHEVNFGADFIFCNRDYSDIAIQKAIDRLYRKFAGNFSGYDGPRMHVSDYRNGDVWRFYIPGISGRKDQEWFRREFNACLFKSTDCAIPKNSPTAARIIYLGVPGAQIGDVGSLQLEDA